MTSTSTLPRKLTTALIDQGFQVSRTAKNRITVRKNGVRITTIAPTSSEPRALKNALSHLKRAGFDPTR
jgi:hypothetical protein